MDLIIFALSLFAAYFIRFEGAIPDIYLKQITVLLPYIIIARFISFQAFFVYKVVWRYISIPDAVRILKGVLPITAILVIARYFAPDRLAMLRIPISVITLEFLLVILGTAGIRMIRRLSLEATQRESAARRRNFGLYQEALEGLPGIAFMPEAAYGRSNRWLTCVTVEREEFGATREDIRLALEAENIEARPVWKPMHLQPVFASCRRRGGETAAELFDRGLCLPSGSNLGSVDLDRIVMIIRRTGKK